MKILFYNFGAFTYPDTKEYLERNGHTVETFFYPVKDRINDPIFSELLDSKIKEASYDLLFSINFFPLVALAAKENSLPYLSWSYDSPLSESLVPFFDMPGNIICLFDRAEVNKYNKAGYKNVYHVPLAVNTSRLMDTIKNGEKAKYTSDVSFVGDLHFSPLPDLLNSMSEYNKGFVTALLYSQMELYGYDIITPSLSNNIIASINNDFRKVSPLGANLTKTGLVFAMQKELTHAERLTVIEELASKVTFNLYSYDKYNFDSILSQKGSVSYKDEMPCVFSQSKINLCPTSRSISSGIPLRALDILGSKGLLLTNFQQELYEEFTDGEDCLIYTSFDEAIEKALFYLEKEDEMERIRQNGFEKVSKLHSYDTIMPLLLSHI